jgi:hypothetical protein
MDDRAGILDATQPYDPAKRISGLTLCGALLLLLRVIRTVTRLVRDSPFGVRAEVTGSAAA